MKSQKKYNSSRAYTKNFKNTYVKKKKIKRSLNSHNFRFSMFVISRYSPQRWVRVIVDLIMSLVDIKNDSIMGPPFHLWISRIGSKHKLMSVPNLKF